MIRSFRHRELKNLYKKNSTKGLRADQVQRIARILARLESATEATHMNLPAFRLHALKRDLKGMWAVSVSGNWRIVFRFEGADAHDIDLVDYH